MAAIAESDLQEMFRLALLTGHRHALYFGKLQNQFSFHLLFSLLSVPPCQRGFAGYLAPLLLAEIPGSGLTARARQFRPCLP